MDNVLSNKINDFMQAYCDVWPFSGSVLVAKKGEIIFEKGYSYASIEHSVPNTPQTKFRICSISKQFTSMAIMMLYERGLLDIYDFAYKYFPQLEALDKRITIHQLLTHTSGIDTVFGKDYYRLHNMHSHCREDMFDLIRTMPAMCEPGEAWNYSNTGYYLLACIIEDLSGMSYAEFLKKNIFEPLGMKNSGVEKYKEIVPNLATGYYINGDAVVHCDNINMDATMGSGSIYSTVEDLYLWDRALYTEKLVSNNTLEKIFTPYASSGSNVDGTDDKDYSYGWIIDTLHGHKRVWHDGGGVGFTTQIDRYVDDDVAIIVLSNYGFTAVWRIASILAAIVFDEEYKFPNKPEEFLLDSKIYNEYIGMYGEEGAKLVVGQDKDKKYFVIDDEFVIPMYPISETLFHHTWIDECYNFDRVDDGNLYLWGAQKVQD